ncbi:hypothetical protein HPDFL43_00026760 [Hoeflea phototrophica DFL-43]|uniref:Uncharacterized protein n=1 Tax=Hoeflea phototrophica (strain DSM 17068 / NCIMB 14078 / DFL-43) TaxID=411684 RepID=A0A094Z0F0_HOEPD|nr:hypothetical protein HPDFL43_00026760 [Hoeflea phototrophica DFL-43]
MCAAPSHRKRSRFIPTLRRHAIIFALPLPDGSRTCRTRREEGLLRIWRNVRQFAKGGGHHRSSAGGRSLIEERAKPATGPGFASCQPHGWIWAETPVRACGGHERLSLAGQGPCRTPKKPFPWPVQAAAGAIRAGVKSRECEVSPVGCGHHPASFGPRAGCATHYLHSFRRQSPRAALRTLTASFSRLERIQAGLSAWPEVFVRK